MIHTVKCFSIVNEAEVYVFLEFPCFSYDLADVGNLISDFFAFLDSACTWFTYYWSLAWRILNINLLACEMSTVVQYFEHSLALPFLGVGMKTDLFHSCGFFQSYTVGGMPTGTTTMENSMKVPEKTIRTTIWPWNPTPGHISGEKHDPIEYMQPNVHCNTVYSSQDLKAI